MKTTPLARAAFHHMLKVWGLSLLALVPFVFMLGRIPTWLFVFLFFTYGIFIFIPIVFGIGPIGRRFGRNLNEAAIAQRKSEYGETASESLGADPKRS